MKKWSLLTIFLCLNSSLSIAASTAWRITQPAWTTSHETQFGNFVTRIGKAVENRECSTVASCLRSNANMFFGSDPGGLRFYADCADFPYYLRAYFAWKNGLPFSYVKQVVAQPTTESTSSDLRYTSAGNLVEKRADIITNDNLIFKNTYPNAVEILNETFSDYISTATYRMSGIYEGEKFSDFYPTKINRQSIRPGTVIYDTNGHVAIIYKISDDGRIFYIDAHPDNSVTTGMFTAKFSRSNPDHGAGFKNFRPLTLTGARKDPTGAYIGGKIIGAKNSQLPWYGAEQFFGTERSNAGWNRGTFSINGKTVDFLDYVRLSLTTGEQHINPLEDLRFLVKDICANLRDRVTAVDASRTSGVYNNEHPDHLPENIYAADANGKLMQPPLVMQD